MFFDANRFHAVVFTTWLFTLFFGAQMIFPIFSNYKPAWRCWPNETFGRSCRTFNSCPHSVEFDHKFFDSAALEFGWVCGKNSYIASLMSQIQFGGVLFGTISFGSLSDRFGRKPISLLALTSGVIFCTLFGLSVNWQMLLALRFLLGLSIGGAIVVVYTFVVELLLPQQRMPLRGIFNWGIVRLALTLICFFLPHWRWASIACAVATLPAVLLILFVLPESPTWLHSKGRIEEMRRSERYIAGFSGVEYKEVERISTVHGYTFSQLVRQRSWLKRISNLWLMWFISSLCGYAIDLNSSSISGHLFLNQVLFSVITAISKFILLAVDTFRPSFSRRNLHQYAQSVVIVCFLALTVLILLGHHHVNRLGLVVVKKSL
jgi:MFS family permease